MSAETKRREILQMLAKGSISADEASELLGQLKNEPATVPPAPETPEPPQMPEPSAPRGKPRWLNVRVTDAATQRNKVSVRIPLSLARVGLRMGAKFAPEIAKVGWDDVLSELSATDVGTLVEVQDEEDGEHVKIYIS